MKVVIGILSRVQGNPGHLPLAAVDELVEGFDLFRRAGF
jgi:hypothetical protein